MASGGRGRRGGERSNNPQPSTFDQQELIEAIGVVATTIAPATAVATTIAQASAIGSQGGSSNL